MKKPNFVWAPGERLIVVWSLSEWLEENTVINSTVQIKKREAMQESYPNPAVWRSNAKAAGK